MRAPLLLSALLTGCAYYEDRALPVAQPEQVTAIVSRSRNRQKPL